MISRDGHSFTRSRSGLLAAMVMLALAGSPGPVLLADGEPADAPLPEITPTQLAAKLREAMARYDDRGTFRVVFADTRDMNHRFGRGRETPEAQKPILVSFRGRARYESDGTRWHVEYDSMMPSSGSTRLSPDRWSTGFDGDRRYEWQISKNKFVVGVSYPYARQWSPRSVIWERGEELVRMLEDANRDRTSIAIAQQVIDGVRCYVVENKSADGQWGGENIISPRQGYLTIARRWTRRGQAYTSRILRGVREIAPGLWAPERVEDETTNVRDDGTSRFDSRRRMQVVEYRPGRVPPEAAFRVEIPYGVDVVDHPAGTSYRNDPWWPEVGAMLREKFGWPPPDFSALRTLGSTSEKDLQGQPAPPLRIASWLNTPPMDLAALKGKVVLVEFGNIEDEYEHRYTPALNALYAAYHPAGLDVISIHAPESNAEEVRRFARDYRLPYPVVIDEGRPGSSGATAEAFGIRGRICAFVIDPRGKTHMVGEPTPDGGRVIETIVPLLKESGVRDVKPVSLETPQLRIDAFQAADRFWQAKVKEARDAAPTGKIRCRIVDGSHHPIPGARVGARLQFFMMASANPGTHYLILDRAAGDRLGAPLEADGGFELSGLCKGEYLLRAEAPGRAWAERSAYIAPSLQPASIDIVLAQGDAIAGQVRDPEGKPIVGAHVLFTRRQHLEDGELRYTAFLPQGPVRQTDGAGRFRVPGLQEGRYIIDVLAPGFQKRQLEGIPAGDEAVTVTLERSP